MRSQWLLYPLVMLTIYYQKLVNIHVYIRIVISILSQKNNKIHISHDSLLMKIQAAIIYRPILHH